MTHDQLTAMIDTLLRFAHNEVEACNGCKSEFQRDSWIAHMTAATVFGGLVDALIAARRAGIEGKGINDLLADLEQKET